MKLLSTGTVWDGLVWYSPPLCKINFVGLTIEVEERMREVVVVVEVVVVEVVVEVVVVEVVVLLQVMVVMVVLMVV